MVSKILKAMFLALILFICFDCCLSYKKSHKKLENSSKPKPIINPHATLECHRREYTFKATNSDSSGKQCWEYITVLSCWGRCDSGEVSFLINIHLIIT